MNASTQQIYDDYLTYLLNLARTYCRRNAYHHDNSSCLFGTRSINYCTVYQKILGDPDSDDHGKW